jgi:hypothetical protein
MRLRASLLISALLVTAGLPAVTAAAHHPEPVGPPLCFSAENLYGRIDGGAELFLEFGFHELVIQEYRVGAVKLELETYVMESPLAALGIYLAKCGHETPVDGLAARNTGNRYQILALKGNCYLQMNNFAGDAAFLPDMTALLARAAADVPEVPESDIWQLLPAAGQVPGSRRLFRGPYALEPIYTFGEGDVLQLAGQVFGVLADYRDNSDRTWTRLVIPYPDAETARRAFLHLRDHLDPYLQVVRAGPDQLAFRDYRSEHGQVLREGSFLQLDIHLMALPE